MPQVPQDAIATLRALLQGSLLQPGDDGYEGARAVWNARLSRRPAMIARCAGPDDVAAAVRFAARHGLPVAVKGGGHDYAGNGMCDGGLVIDLSTMRSVEVDPGAMRVRVGPGATWAEVDAATQAFGLATPGATVSSVGVAGFTLGGGVGHLARRFGLACDNLDAAEVVTADGRRVRASADEHPELYWALRGGGGNFGIVTCFELRLHRVGPQVLAGQLIHRWDDAAAVLRHYRDFMASAPDEVQCWAFMLRLPPLDVFPQALHGQPVIDLLAVHSGEPHAAAEVLRPLREFGTPLLDAIEPQRYTALQQASRAPMAPTSSGWPISSGNGIRATCSAATITSIRRTEPAPAAAHRGGCRQAASMLPSAARPHARLTRARASAAAGPIRAHTSGKYWCTESVGQYAPQSSTRSKP